MIRLTHAPILLAACLAAAHSPAQSSTPAPASTNRPVHRPINLPAIPKIESPVFYFRQLLLMSPPERKASLADRTPQARERILAKVREYLALPPDVRELRLRATELRWYLMPMLQTAPANRASQFERMPPELREIAAVRLAQWDRLPTATQKEYLTNDAALHYFAQAVTSANAGTNAETGRIAEQFAQLFELTSVEKTKLLGTLSEPERRQMEKTMAAFDGLPAAKREICIRNFARFTNLSEAERDEFLKNADSWSKLSPAERQNWRNLVSEIPLWPPTPLPGPAKHTMASVETN